jgi:phospholipid/cholesterol/gamma-HCH transport system permease protein
VNRRKRLLESIGESTEGAFEEVGGLAELLGESLATLAACKLRVAETLSQAYILGVASCSIVVLTALFTGMVFALESALQAVQYGVGSIVGGAVSYTSARELGPMLSGVVVAGRAGAAIAAELGSMVVTEQVEALNALGLSPVRMLVVPRLVALVVMMPLLTIMADVVSISGGMWLAKEIAHIDYPTFIDSARANVHIGDFLRGLVKSSFFGLIIALVGSYQGLRTHGGAAGVGIATTRAVVTSIITIFITNFLLSYMLYGYHS